MAFLLYRYIRGKRQARNEVQAATAPVTNEYLNPEPFLRPEDQPTSQNAAPAQGQDTTQSAPQTMPQAVPMLTSEGQAAQERSKEEARRLRNHRIRLITCLVLPSFLSSVDVTIVAPAITTISSHFNRLGGSFNWIVAAYTLTFTTFVPASGQLAEIYGRHFALQFQMFFILIGSVFCAAAVTWPMLLFGRALQGVGGAGTLNLGRIILTDGMSLADASKNNSILSLIAGLSYAVGPVIGGYLAASSWRYCFVLPIPVSVLAMVLIFVVARKDLVKGHAEVEAHSSRPAGFIAGLAIIDWFGLILFILGIGLFILGLQWGGTAYAWTSPATLAPLIIGALLCMAFFVNEYLLGPGRMLTRIFPHQVAMISSSLFRKKDTALLVVIDFSAGISLVSAFYFVSYYWQLAEGYSSAQSGVQLLYYTPGLGVGVYTAMFLCNVAPRQTFPPLFVGSVVETLGLSVMTWAISSRHQVLVKVFLAVAGAGTGLRFMPLMLHAAGTWPQRNANIQSLLSFVLPFGQTIGITVMGAVFSNKFARYLVAVAAVGAGNDGAGFTSSTGPANLEALSSLPPETLHAVRDAAAKAVMWAFISILPFMACSLVAAACLGNVWIGRVKKVSKEGVETKREEGGQVLEGCYLLAAVTGRTASLRHPIDKRTGEGGETMAREKVADVEK